MGKPSVRIAVMGVTGAGKSTFIQTASDLDVGIGHELQSFTAEVEPFEFDYAGLHITLIDTPGFNDTTRSETEVLRSIADWLDFSYRNPPHLKLTGIIYLQSIMDPRMYGSSLRNLKMFKELVGPEPLQNVVLATTRWGQLSKSGEVDMGESREKQLCDDETYWKPMISRGSRVARFEDTRDSALNLILSLIEAQPKVLQIQSELVDQKKDLIDTSAGTAVNEEVKRLESKYKEELQQIQFDLDKALEQNEADVQEALEHAKADFERKLDRVHAEQDLLRYESRNQSRKMRDEYEQLQLAYQQKLGAQKLDFDETVRILQANESKLRKEQRDAMNKQIEEMKKQKKGSPGRTGMKLVAGLLPVVGSVVLGLLGIPVGLGGLMGGGGGF
ncbi:hypothetical protein LTR78_009562 [Recurvomyces mirabilis]|uniref:G domain-containing protein n=1 Tax=Recurvomyces mirabilis TaxID=574656 RepID=A0AAE0TPE4_9PEZI|nr:hypothetical protein LTR78_009562 [Recurvomyces mirabilis]KAK5149983.1 hypothetical protein LTS14_010455 [Recurvomyces mirabilis]